MVYNPQREEMMRKFRDSVGCLINIDKINWHVRVRSGMSRSSGYFLILGVEASSIAPPEVSGVTNLERDYTTFDVDDNFHILILADGAPHWLFADNSTVGPIVPLEL
jgi:hypothetical protein